MEALVIRSGAVWRVAVTRGAWRLTATIALLLAPLAVFHWLMVNPRQNREFLVPLEHFGVVTNVSVIALVLAVLLARGATQIGQYRLLFTALGYMNMAGLFSVHAIATPGILLHGSPESYGHTVIGLSATFSLFVPSLFFAARYSPIAAYFERHRCPTPGVLAVGILALLLVYALLAVFATATIEDLPFGSPPLSHVVAAVSIGLLAFAAWREAEAYRRSRMPMRGALAVAFVLLAEAQLEMVLGRVWTLAWWEYHVLMLTSVVIAVAALFVELDRRLGLERFLPAPLVERVVSGGALRLAGERRVVTIVFADLRGSTALAEGLSAEEIVELLNRFLGTLTKCVFDCEGALDKFIGDGLMAIFGIAEDPSNGAVPAARAALQMRSAIAALNREREAVGQPRLRFGVGINTGEVLLGVVGTSQRSDFTAIGDTVNTASRMEGLCKHFDVDVVLSGETAARIAAADLQPRPLGEARVHGKAQPVQAFTLG